jgi:hypothetical protein
MDSDRTSAFFILMMLAAIPLYAYLMAYASALRTKAVERAGRLLLELPLESPQSRFNKLQKPLIIVFAIFFIVVESMCLYQITLGRPVRMLDISAALSSSLCLWVSIISQSGLQQGVSVGFYELGILWRTTLLPWDSIREWNWFRGGSTLVLKTGRATFSFHLRDSDKEVVEAIMNEHASGCTVGSQQASPS